MYSFPAPHPAHEDHLVFLNHNEGGGGAHSTPRVGLHATETQVLARPQAMPFPLASKSTVARIRIASTAARVVAVGAPTQRHVPETFLKVATN